MNMIINEIEKEKKNKTYLIKFSNNKELICNEELIVNYLLRKGKEIDDQTYEILISKANVYIYYDKALIYLTKGLKSEHKIYTYLIGKGANNDEACEVVDILKSKKLLNDTSYFKHLTDYYLHNQYGPFYIEQKGRLENIDSQIIDNIISEIDYSFLSESIDNLIKKYLKINNKISDKNKLKFKLKSYLFNRGFPSELINKKIGEI